MDLKYTEQLRSVNVVIFVRYNSEQLLNLLKELSVIILSSNADLQKQSNWKHFSSEWVILNLPVQKSYVLLSA